MNSEVRQGVIVRHARFGLGKVISLDADSVWIYFKDVEGEPKDAIKHLKVSHAGLTVAENQTDPVWDNLPPMVVGGVVTPPRHVRLTEAQSLDVFVRTLRSFEDSEYRRRERDYKWEAHKAVRDQLLSEQGRNLLQADGDGQLADVLKRLFQCTNLLATQELMRLSDAFRVPTAAERFGCASVAFIDRPDAETFGELVSVVGGLDDGKGGRILTWPVVTYLPFFADPSQHMFLKPQMTKRVADAFLFDLQYDATPSWSTYQRLVGMSEMLLNRLRPLGAKDYIDVHSFIWVIAGAPFMRPRQVRGATD